MARCLFADRLRQFFQRIGMTGAAVDAGDIAFGGERFGNRAAGCVTSSNDEGGRRHAFSSVHCSGCWFCLAKSIT